MFDSWETLAAVSAVGWLLMTIADLATASYFRGRIIAELHRTSSYDNYSIAYTSAQESQRAFWAGCQATCLLWPFHIIMAIGYFFGNGVEWIFDALTEGIEKQTATVAKRAQLLKFQEQYDELCDKEDNGGRLTEMERDKKKALVKQGIAVRAEPAKPVPEKSGDSRETMSFYPGERNKW